MPYTYFLLYARPFGSTTPYYILLSTICIRPCIFDTMCLMPYIAFWYLLIYTAAFHLRVLLSFQQPTFQKVTKPQCFFSAAHVGNSFASSDILERRVLKFEMTVRPPYEGWWSRPSRPFPVSPFLPFLSLWPGARSTMSLSLSLYTYIYIHMYMQSYLCV